MAPGAWQDPAVYVVIPGYPILAQPDHLKLLYII
jgi:hypothetical protein